MSQQDDDDKKEQRTHLLIAIGFGLGVLLVSSGLGFLLTGQIRFDFAAAVATLFAALLYFQRGDLRRTTDRHIAAIERKAQEEYDRTRARLHIIEAVCQPQHTGSPLYYIRCHLLNNGEAAARLCQPILKRTWFKRDLLPEGSPGDYTTASLHGDWFFDPVSTPAPLPWSAKQFPSIEGRQLVPNRPYFFDIGGVDSRQKLPICRTDHGNPNHTLEPDRYSLEIVAYAENGQSQTAWVDFDLRRWQWPREPIHARLSHAKLSHCPRPWNERSALSSTPSPPGDASPRHRNWRAQLARSSQPPRRRPCCTPIRV